MTILQNGANNSIIFSNGCSYITSYNSVIAKVDNKKVTLGKDYNYSNTTTKHLNKSLKMCGVDLDKFKIDLKNGKIEIKDYLD